MSSIDKPRLTGWRFCALVVELEDTIALEAITEKCESANLSESIKAYDGYIYRKKNV